MNPIEIFEKRFCEKCTTKSCEAKSMVSLNKSVKIPCLLATLIILEMDRIVKET